MFSGSTAVTPKLLLLNVVCTSLIVWLLAFHFPSDRLTAARAELERRGHAYSSAIAEQISREGATSVDAVARDGEVTHVLLLTAADGQAPMPAVETPYVLEFKDRLALVRGVAGAAHGTLIVELSTESLTRARAEMTRTAVAGGLAALALGLVLAFLLGRIGRALAARAARERAIEFVVFSGARPANDTEPESLPRAG